MLDIKLIDPNAVDDDEEGIDPELDLLRVGARALEKHERLKAELDLLRVGAKAPEKHERLKAELDLLRVGAKAIEKHERLKAELRQHERHLSLVCQTYGSVYRVWGFRPEHLRQACVARGLMK